MGGLIGAGLIRPIAKLAQKTVVNPVTKKAVSVGAEQFKRVLEHCPKLEKFIQKTTPLFARAYEKLNNLPMRSETIDWLKNQVKFDGFLEEMGEEVLEDVLNLTIGTNDEERNLENYVKAIFKTPEEWAVIAGVIGLQGETISLAGNLLADAMQRSGVPENKIAEVIQNSTENEKHDLTSGLIDDGTIQLSDLTDEERARQREIKNDIYQKLTNIGIKNEEANDLSILTGSMFEKYGTKNDESRKVFDDYMNNLVVKYNIPAENPNIHYQNNNVNIKQFQDKQTNNTYNSFVDTHKNLNLIENTPDYWNGSNIEEAKEFLNFGKNNMVKIKSPIEEITINEGHLKLLIEDNNSHRKKYLNRVLRTIENPNIILKDGVYHNYIKLFKDKNSSIKPHLQIVKVKNDGSFYVTNYKPTTRQFKQLLQREVI